MREAQDGFNYALAENVSHKIVSNNYDTLGEAIVYGTSAERVLKSNRSPRRSDSLTHQAIVLFLLKISQILKERKIEKKTDEARPPRTHPSSHSTPQRTF